MASTTLLRVELDAPSEVKSQSRACKTGGSIGRMRSKEDRAVAQVRTVHQLRQALTRVARAVPRGAIMFANARLMSSIVVGMVEAMEVTMGSQFPRAWSSGDPAEPLWRATAQEGQKARSAGPRRSWVLPTVGMLAAVHQRGSEVWAERADSMERR